MQGVFVIRNKKAMFVPVTTGITGTTDIEVLDGVKEGDEVITGSYKVLRTLRPGSSVKIDNTAPKKEEEEHNLSWPWNVQRESQARNRSSQCHRSESEPRKGAEAAILNPTIGEVSGTGREKPGEKHGNRRSHQYAEYHEL